MAGVKLMLSSMLRNRFLGSRNVDDAKVDLDAPPDIMDPGDVRVWGTKGIHFWALLGAILIKTRPKSLLEFGSGRSTTFLADYAVRHRAPCVSIEQSDIWHKKVASDLQFMKVKGNHVHHVPLAKTKDEIEWYEYETAKRLIGGRAFDFVFVDGPTGGARKSPSGRALIREAARKARLILVDDVHRPYNNKFFLKLSERFPRDGIFYYRYGQNLVAIAVDEWRPIVRSSFEFLELDHFPVLPQEIKTDDDEDGAG